jgi:hypothetical protein
MKHLFILLFIILSGCSFAQENELISNTSDLVIESLKINEINPIYQKESDSINDILKTSLALHFKHKKSDQKVSNIFHQLYKNGSSIYSDSPEVRRMKQRRSVCFGAIALLSDYDVSLTFSDYAKYSLAGSIEEPDIEFLEAPFLGLIFIEILLKYENNELVGSDLQVLERFINQHKENLSKEIIHKSESLLSNYKKICR